MVIGAYLQAPLKPFGGVLVGVQEAGCLRYVGSVRTGFSNRDLALVAKLRLLEVAKSAFVGGPKPSVAVHWVRPELVASVEIAEWTASGKLRQASFKGLREDLSPAEVVRERPPVPVLELEDQ